MANNKDEFDALLDDPNSIEVDLDAWIIPDGHQVFKFSAGKTYRFLRAVHDAHTAFLDVRGLDQLDHDPRKWIEKDVLRVIANDRWNRELQSRERGNKEKGSEGASAQDRKVLTFLRRLVKEAKQGDLVVIPPNDYTKDVLIGEFTTGPGEVERVTARDGEETHVYVGRPVVWRNPFEKRLASAELLEKLHNPNAVFTLGRSLRHEVYRWAYENFIADGAFVASFHTEKHRFTAEDHAVVATWLNAFDVLRNSLAEGDSREGESFEGLGLEKLPDDLAAEVKINIQSPGDILVRSGTPFALSLLALFALSGCDTKQVQDNNVTVRLKHVGAGDEGLEKAVEQDVNALKTALGETRIEKQAALARRAREDAKVTAKANLNLGRKGSK